MDDEIKPPRGEKIWTAGYNSDGLLLYFLTTKVNTHGPFFIYAVEDGAYRKLGSSKSPLILEEKFFPLSG